jgi:outer membrane protein OmpA-like peptidoglycan-associated protein
MPAAQSPRGALGQPGLRTEDDATRGVEGGFFTDVHHRPNVGAPGATQGTPLSPRYDFQPTPAGGAPQAGLTQQPAQYGGATGGVVGQTPGFKRSEDPADVRSAALYDTPGNPSAAANVNFEFESVAKGEDTMVVYGTVKWGFGLRAGKVVNEYLNTDDTASTTFAEALERHRDFYVHEPVTFYFPFDSHVLDATELTKIDSLLAYLARNPTVRMSLQGFADVKGGVSAHNTTLSLDRAEAVEKALVDKGVDPGRIDDIMIGLGASSSATLDAGTGDQGGNAAVGADQKREANRWANRRVVLTFEQTASTPVGGAGP